MRYRLIREVVAAARKDKKTKRQEILDRLNSYNDELNADARQREKELERERWYEREKAIERGKRTSGF